MQDPKIARPNSYQKEAEECPFCRSDDISRDDILLRTTNFYVRFDKFPATRGHVEVVPKRHILSFFELSSREMQEAYAAMRSAKAVIDSLYGPDAYNIGVNDGVAAGRSINHLHIHLIPRYSGDTPDPRAGIRRGLPNGDPALWGESLIASNEHRSLP